MDTLYWLMGYNTEPEIEAAPNQIRYREALLKDIKNMSEMPLEKPTLIRKTADDNNFETEKKTSTNDRNEEKEEGSFPAWRLTQSGAWTRMNSFAKKKPRNLKKKFRSDYPELYK
jgi:hypothetical protein